MTVTGQVESRGVLDAMELSARTGRLLARITELTKQGMEREFIPELKSRSPRRTGLLRDSLRMTDQGPGKLGVRAIFYAPRITASVDNRGRMLGESQMQPFISRLARMRLPNIARRAVRRAVIEGTNR